MRIQVTYVNRAWLDLCWSPSELELVPKLDESRRPVNSSIILSLLVWFKVAHTELVTAKVAVPRLSDQSSCSTDVQDRENRPHCSWYFTLG